MNITDVVKNVADIAKGNKKGQTGGVVVIVGIVVAAIVLGILGLQVGYPIVLRASNVTAAASLGASTTDQSILTYLPTLYLVCLLMVEVGLMIGALYVGLRGNR